MTTASTKTAHVLRHLHFEDLGTFAAPIRAAGYDIVYHDVGDAGFPAEAAGDGDLMVVLGGPVGVYETATYPFIEREIALVRKRLAAGRPLLGICLGAQIIAAASGARVFPFGAKEIGFKTVSLHPAARSGPLRHLDNVPVLHWHGDTYELPAGATNLASSDLVAQQAFSIGTAVLGLQFHPEADCGPGFERWLVGHAAELAAARIDIVALRRDAARHGEALANAAHAMMTEWLATLETST